ncbi:MULTISPECIES: MBL fold metallo-hydrolase [Brucella]|uniref:Beta-lactamase superfamily domain protein n=1 Tax=Brucella lupini TaxID=255457 RepID=A0A256GHJ6_9HYPH|nr:MULTISPECIES: MBL fold metallo-hydrolase [Brucella]KAB2702874.1 MBL fold metallo-hydrolase [Brucella lupini]KAB2728013.1 MBL fold metallo-hydrolase [Brucella anthropi]KAB2745185.1 MBL fold metallo-hydrolase [Brucella anthropi]KAB2800019.1 MBL fold metallo-hydrolase [Brucella anthropi]KAB2805610.1 MBL fold metallo-hydrolase [Brucella anthropi]
MNISVAAPFIPRPLHGNLAGALSQSLQRGDDLALFWLGQAGFALVAAGRLLVIDPYLSDSLAEKYRGTTYPHERMMPAPIQPEELPRLDAVLVTHRHTDHMDPGTLPALARTFAQARFIVPEAELTEASLRTGLAIDTPRLVGVNAGEVMELGAGLSLTVFPAAHETPETDAAGRHRFLGYGIEIPGLRLWHSGDCVPFSSLVPLVKAFRPDVALLPVNGRDRVLRAAGVPGNFTLDEAIATARDVGASQLIAHHYGMFDFNSCAPEAIDEAARWERSIFVSRALADVVYDGNAESGLNMRKNNG